VLEHAEAKNLASRPRPRLEGRSRGRGTAVLQGRDLKISVYSLRSTFNRLFMKLIIELRTGSIDAAKDCRCCFGIEMPGCLVQEKQDKFLSPYKSWC